MASVARNLERRIERSRKARALPPLEVGDHLDQETFHARYEAMRTDRKYELIGGVVYMTSPAKLPHGRSHKGLIYWLGDYEDATPGTEVILDTSAILSEEDEPQPDAGLLILPEFGGRTREVDGWLIGGPELTAESASSTESLDLHGKKTTYEKAGVREYIVVALRQMTVFWFIKRRRRFESLSPGPDGIFRSETFPGLWLDPDALLRKDRKRVRKVLQQGLATPEHAAFVARLAAHRRR